MRTVRSFCRICTSVCGILVDVAGDEVVRVRGDHDHPFSHGYTCPKGRALPRMHHHPDRLERPLMRVGDGPAAHDLGRVPRRPRDAAARHHRPPRPRSRSASSSAAASGWTRPATGRPRRCTGRSARRRGSVPLTIDGTAKVLVTDQVGGFPGLNPHVDFERARLVVYVGVNPVVSHGHTSALPDPVTAIRDVARARRRLGRRPAPHRDRAARHPPSRAAPGHRLRGPRVSSFASCCATAPTATCSSTRRSAATRSRPRSSRSRSSTRHASPTSANPSSPSCSTRCAGPGASASSPVPASRCRRART